MNIMNPIAWAVLGGVAGWLASRVMGTNERQGCLTNIIVGVVGAAIGGFITTRFFGGAGVTGFNFPSLLVAVIGSIILLWIVRALRK
jgi:uncharacterized membrane protein YeaQ/YmgE (transglycosylase-associated protein family)